MQVLSADMTTGEVSLLTESGDTKEGDLMYFNAYPGCSSHDDDGAELDKDCGLSHWKVKLGLKMCEMEDIGDWSDVCVEDDDGKEHCATDYPKNVWDGKGWYGEKCKTEDCQKYPFSYNMGSTEKCQLATTGTDSTTDEVMDVDVNSEISTFGLAAVNDFSCAKSGKCDADMYSHTAVEEEKCNPMGYLCNPHIHYQFTVSGGSYKYPFMSSFFSDNCKSAGSPYSGSVPASLASSVSYAGGSWADTNLKTKKLYKKWVKVAPAAAAGGAKSGSTSRLSMSLLSTALCTVAFFLHMKH